MAYELEQMYSKDEILEMYLNYIYFGNGAYGVEAAAKTYFGVRANELTLAQAALLAGVIKGPSRYAPHINLKSPSSGATLVLSEMYKLGYITRSQKEQAEAEKWCWSTSPKTGMAITPTWCCAKRNGYSRWTARNCSPGGYRIYTTLDQDIQKYSWKRCTRTARCFPKNAADGALCQSAFCVMDSETSEILAIGGREYETRRGLNRSDGHPHGQPYAPPSSRRIVYLPSRSWGTLH